VLIVDEDPTSFLQDRGVGAVPGHPQTLSDPGDGEVLDDDALQRPTQPAPGESRARLGGSPHVLSPHARTPRTLVVAHAHHQRHRPPSLGLVGEATHHGVTRDPFAPALMAPPILLHHPTRQLAAIRQDFLTHRLQSEIVQTRERRQVRTGEGSVGQVRVFQMAGVETSIIGRPRPPHPPRHASWTRPRLHPQLG
jgi:hypothetical protein